MRDPVALAYSGRIDEARGAAIAQAAGEDEFLVAQGLEALGVLGAQHGVRTDAEIDAVLVRRAAEGGATARRAFEAAAALEARALEAAAVARFTRREVGWDLLRYVGELPSLALSRAFAAAWDEVPDRLRDEAILTSRVLPVATEAECVAWGKRIAAFAQDGNEEVRRAAFQALFTWRPALARDTCARSLEDPVQEVRVCAARALAAIDPELLADRAEELEQEFPEVAAEVPFAVRVRRTHEKRGR